MGEESGDLRLELAEGLVFGDGEPVAGGADDAVDAAAGLVFAEEPLEGAVDEGEVAGGEDGAVQPEVSAEDGDGLELVEAGEASVGAAEVFGDPLG